MHVDLQQVAPVEQANPPAAPGQRPAQRDVVGQLAAPQREAAGRGQRPAGAEQALAVDDQAGGPRRAGRPDRAEPVDQGGEHAGVQGLFGRAVTPEPRARADQVEGSLGGGGHQRGGQPRPRPRVGVDRQHEVTAGRLQALLQRPLLAGPPGGQRLARQDPGPGPGRDLRGGVGRVVVDDDDLADTGVGAQPGQARPDPRRLVAGGHDRRHRHARGQRVPGAQRRAHRAPPGQPGCQHRGGGRLRGGDRPHPSLPARWSAVIMPATIRAPMVTSGSPPPGCTEPPTRYSPATGPRFPGRRNGARRPLCEVP